MTSATDDSPLDGGCACRAVRYRLQGRPLFVHCCHCTWCQRESGSAFAVNAMIEADRVEPALRASPRGSSRRRRAAPASRSPVARNAESRSGATTPAPANRSASFASARLDEPDRLPPDIHIFTSTKQPWVVLPAGVPAVPEYYDSKQYWPAESLERRKVLRARAGR